MSKIMDKYAARARALSKRHVPLVKATVGADTAAALVKGTALDVDFREFVRMAWPIVNPGTELIWNWHIDAICGCLEAVEYGRIKRLVINIPPGLMKSCLTTVLWPVWRWTKRPSRRIMSVSHTLSLSERDTRISRELIASQWFQDTFIPTWVLKDDENKKLSYVNSAFGSRKGLAVASKGFTGFRADSMIIDDPLDASAIQDGRLNIQDAVEKVNNWYDDVASTRLDNPEKADIVLVMQRLHEIDLAGHLLGSGNWEHLCLPEEYDPDAVVPIPTGMKDPRTEKGELLFPQYHTRQFCNEKRDRLGPVQYDAQYNQNPTPTNGDYFHRDWFTLSDAVPQASDFSMIMISIDATFIGGKTSDNVSIGVWGIHGTARWRIDEYCKQLNFTDTKAAIIAMYQRYPSAAAVLIEDKANGPALICDLRNIINCIVPVSTNNESKELRAFSVQGIVMNGHVWLPASAPWLEDYLKEMSGFPRRMHDDRVDETTQLLRYVRDAMLVGSAGASFEAGGLRPPM